MLFPRRSLAAVVVLFLFGYAEAQEKQPVLVKVVTNDKDILTGELGRENGTHIELIALDTGTVHIFQKDDLLSIRKPIPEKIAIEAIGLPTFLAWKVKKSLPSEDASGSIAKVEGALIYATLGTENGLAVGNKLVVYRGDEEVKDPKTGKVIGKQRLKIAELEITDVREKLSKVKPLGDLEVKLMVGDTVERAVSNSAVAIFPLINNEGEDTTGTKRLAEELTTGFVQKGIKVIEWKLIDKVLDELNIQRGDSIDTEKAQRVGKKVGAFAVVVGTIAPKAKYFEAQLRLVKVDTGEILAASSKIIRDESLTQTVKNRPPLSKKGKGVSLQSSFLEGNKNADDWTVLSKEWRMAGTGLESLGRKGGIISKTKFKNVDSVEIYLTHMRNEGKPAYPLNVNIWGTDLQFPFSNGRLVAKLVRDGEKIAFAVNNKPPQIAYVTNDPGEPTAIRIAYTKPSNDGGKVSVTFHGIIVRGGEVVKDDDVFRK